MKRLKVQVLGLCGLVILFFSGCATLHHPPLSYTPEPSILEEDALIDVLLIEKITNAQPEEETLRFNPNNDPWILMPFCFYSGQKVNPLVKRNYFQNNLDDALQRLFVKDLLASNISKTIINSCQLKTSSKELQNNYRLELILKHAVWDRSLTAYGLSYPGTLLWSLCFPVSYGSVTLEVEAALYAPNSTIKPIAKTVLKQKKNCVEFIYDQIGYQPSVSENTLVDIFPIVAKDLREFIRITLKKQKR